MYVLPVTQGVHALAATSSLSPATHVRRVVVVVVVVVAVVIVVVVVIVAVVVVVVVVVVIVLVVAVEVVVIVIVVIVVTVVVVAVAVVCVVCSLVQAASMLVPALNQPLAHASHRPLATAEAATARNRPGPQSVAVHAAQDATPPVLAPDGWKRPPAQLLHAPSELGVGTTSIYAPAAQLGTVCFRHFWMRCAVPSWKLPPGHAVHSCAAVLPSADEIRSPGPHLGWSVHLVATDPPSVYVPAAHREHE